MGYKYHNIRREEHSDGHYYKTDLFIHSVDRETYAPTVGQPSAWTGDEDAVVVDWAAEPYGPHWNYKVVAKSINNVTRHRDDKGIYFQCEFFIYAKNMVNLPVFGDSVTWAPTDETDVLPRFFNYTMVSDDIGRAIVYGFNVDAARTLTLYAPTVAVATPTYIKNVSGYTITLSGHINGVAATTYTLLTGNTISITTNGTTWTVAASATIPGNVPYFFNSDSKMLGDSSYLVTIRACERKYEIGVTAR